jgi:hypothetical protein
VILLLVLLLCLKGVPQAIVFLVERLVFNLEIVKGLSDKICLFSAPLFTKDLIISLIFLQSLRSIGDDLTECWSSSGVCGWNLWRTLSLSFGHIPVASKDFRTRLGMKEDVQALQNNRKKSPFLIGR